MEWMFLPLKRYADFSGRSRRKEYWMFFLFQFLVQMAFMILMILVVVAGGADGGSDRSVVAFFVLIGFWVLFWLAMLIPNVAVVVRRFHDQDIPGIVDDAIAEAGELYPVPRYFSESEVERIVRGLLAPA